MSDEAKPGEDEVKSGATGALPPVQGGPPGPAGVTGPGGPWRLNSYEAVTIIILIATIFVTWHGIHEQERITRDATQAQERLTQLEQFIEMRDRFDEIRPRIPPYDKRNSIRVGDDGWKAFEDYWDHAFQEWFFSRKLCSSHELWEKFYGPACAHSLDVTADNRTRAYITVLHHHFQKAHWPPAETSDDFKRDLCVQVALMHERNGSKGQQRPSTTDYAAMTRLIETHKAKIPTCIGGTYAELLTPEIKPKGPQTALSPLPSQAPEIARGLDKIYSLLAMAVVSKTWDETKKRGYNIGAILISPQGNPVAWSVNRRFELKNSTRHAETQLLWESLSGTGDLAGKTDYEGCSLYSTLEPCAMCTGMACLSKVRNVYYLQIDPGFGGVFEALQAPMPRSHEPYPRIPAVFAQAPLDYGKRLGMAFDRYQASSGSNDIAAFLGTPDARVIFDEAKTEFDKLDEQSLSEDEARVLRTARELLKTVK